MVADVRQRVRSSSIQLDSSDFELKRGFDDEDSPFAVPPTLSVFHSLTSPHLWSGPTMLVVLSMLLNVGIAFYAPTSPTSAIAVFAFFRLSYNIGLGVILHYQSNYRSITKVVSRLLKSPESKNAKFIHWLSRGRMTHFSRFQPSEYPDCFNAWLAFRFIVDIILCNDGLSYVILVLKCWTLPSSFGIMEIIQYLFGFSLAAFNYWAKVDAHRIIGDYSWYWGDMFFILDQNLTFDGIFALVPHPMYTAGYALYYGLALLSRSYIVLIVSLVAHMLQIGFLVFVENPHIERTYGSNENSSDSAETALYDSLEGLFPGKSDALLILRLDLCRPNDLALIITAGYMAAVTYLLPTNRGCIVHATVWLFAHWISIGSILRQQSKHDWWNQHFVSQGYSLHVAFSHWKVLYNFSRTAYLVAIITCAFRVCWIPPSFSYITSQWIASIIGGLALIFVTIYSTVSSYQALGDFGTFYGDFFIPTEFYKSQTRYIGIYRFLNNPECLTGYAGLHGIALISQSWIIFWLALTAQALNFIFIKAVEIPHMEKMYSGTLRQHTPAGSLIRNVVRDQISDQLIFEAERIHERAIQEIFTIYKRLGHRQFAKSSSATQSWISGPESIFQNTPLKCSWRTSGPHPVSDWIGIYKADVDSAPGLSKGRWLTVNEGCSGEIEFPVEKMPKNPGVYEIRYHTGYYQVLAKHVFIVSNSRRQFSS